MLCSTQNTKHGIVYRERWLLGGLLLLLEIGIQDGWEDKFGKLIDIDNEVSLINAMQTMYHTINDYDTQYISNACLNQFSSKKIAGKITDMLKAICSVN